MYRPEIIEKDLSILIWITVSNLIREGTCARLVDNTKYIQTSDLPRRSRSMSLLLSEVGRDSDHNIGMFIDRICLFDFPASMIEYHCRNKFRMKLADLFSIVNAYLR